MNRKLFVGLIVLFLSTSGCQRDAVKPPVTEFAPALSDTKPEAFIAATGPDVHTEGHNAMVKALAQISAHASDDHKWLSDRAARRLRAAVLAIPSGVPGPEHWRLYYDLGQAELRLGNESAAIEQLTTAMRLFSAWQQVSSTVPRDLVNQVTFQLGVAYMRLGETQNCCQQNTPDSCIFPIRGQGIHEKQEPSNIATQYFAQVLENSERDSKIHLQARWLLNIAYMTIGMYPEHVPSEYLIPTEAFTSDEPFPRFVNVAGHAGVDTFSLSGGAIADDFDRDGHLDLVVSTWDPAGQIRFFRNNQDGTFSDHTEHAGLTGILGGLNLVQADVDNDGDTDFVVLRGAWLGMFGRHPNSLVRNNGDGTFTDVTFATGLGDVHYPTQTAAWADYDNDGDLDLYIGNESVDGVTAPCQLFRSNGDSTFTDVARTAGVTNDGYTKAVVWGDYDNDRWPDIYVSNFRNANRLYHNNHDGTFSDVATTTGVTSPRVSFPAWFWDYNNDGALDLYVSSFDSSLQDIAGAYLGRPVSEGLACLYRGDGHGGFEEVSRQSNLTRPTLPMGANFGDLDGDGYPDFYLGTGDPRYEMLMPNVMYRNQDGESFADVTTAGGFGHLQKGHAVVFADFDNDGDEDVFEQLGGAFRGDKFHDALYENPGFKHHWVTVQLNGLHTNRSAVGVRVRIDVTDNAAPRTIYKHVNSGGSFGANPLRQTIGLGRAEHIERMEVFWPTSDQTQTFLNVPVDQTVLITEGQAAYATLSLKTFHMSSERSGETDSP